MTFTAHTNSRDEIDGTYLRIKSLSCRDDGLPVVVNEFFFKNVNLYDCKPDQFTYEGRFSHQKVSRVKRDDIDCLIAESWLSFYWLDLGGFMDMRLAPGDENLFKLELLNHQCFMALNCQTDANPTELLL